MRHKRTPNLEIQAEADRKPADEEERIARLFGMCPGWNYDEFREDFARRWRERRRDGFSGA